ncbi:hypothetical protein OG887_44040 (plasmid) [Streptomyces sp. NBC_00053]|uniref:hypothetical protein n=1 Tax=unclassified Streptomyces TaxID=2593676 RepID=UPI00225011AE|nr:MULTISPECIES: hypothetical protein [unclassified Streptomyces]MCX4400026.1 hypothetical protein [Streptomyces sp. NBC_01767]MCX5505975.1 hypothetical protein [Streptomyces sp. NBC_00052]MCX5554026.1 hypothetical protein [Streptomyces sp. NBC_00051]MCX5554372.1 hypothetical protein [Streptomyces sp. NBC_00051]
MAIAPVVTAIRVLELIAPDGLLFDTAAHAIPRGREATGRTIGFEAMRHRIEDFTAFASELALRLGRPHETVPADPHGAIGTARFRRTLAWHIARRPGGLVALAVQYGHLRTTVSAGYAARGRDGIHELLDIETARATADTLTTLHDDFATDTGISGPAAHRAIHAAAQAPADPRVLTSHSLRPAVVDDTRYFPAGTTGILSFWQPPAIGRRQASFPDPAQCPVEDAEGMGDTSGKAVRDGPLPAHLHGQVRRSRDLKPLAAHVGGGMAPGTGPDLLFPRRRWHRPLPHRPSTHITLHRWILTRQHGRPQAADITPVTKHPCQDKTLFQRAFCSGRGVWWGIGG